MEELKLQNGKQLKAKSKIKQNKTEDAVTYIHINSSMAIHMKVIFTLNKVGYRDCLEK